MRANALIAIGKGPNVLETNPGPTVMNVEAVIAGVHGGHIAHHDVRAGDDDRAHARLCRQHEAG